MIRDIKSTLRLNSAEDKALEDIMKKYNLDNNKIGVIREMIMNYDRKEKELRELKQKYQKVKEDYDRAWSTIITFQKSFKGLMEW